MTKRYKTLNITAEDIRRIAQLEADAALTEIRRVQTVFKGGHKRMITSDQHDALTAWLDNLMDDVWELVDDYPEPTDANFEALRRAAVTRGQIMTVIDSILDSSVTLAACTR